MSCNFRKGQKLKTLTNEYVTIADFDDTYIFVDYKNKIYKRKLSIVGKKLFIIDNPTDKNSFDRENLIMKSTTGPNMEMQHTIG